MNLRRRVRNLHVRDGAHGPHPVAEHRLTCDFDLPVLRRLRCGDRSRITEIEGVAYGAFIVPGLIMLMLLTQSVANASFGIYFPRFTGTIY